MGGSPIWEELETMELLDIWRQAHLQTALRSNVRNKWIWEHVADQLWHRGFVRSGEQCKNKVHNLLCVYRNVCRGRLPRWRCRYFDLLHRVATAKDVADLEEAVKGTEKGAEPPEEVGSPPRRLSGPPGPPRSPEERGDSEKRRLSPPAVRVRRAPPALVPIQYRSAPAPVKAAVGLPVTPEDLQTAVSPTLSPKDLKKTESPPSSPENQKFAGLPLSQEEDLKSAAGLPVCSEEMRRLLTRLWRHYLPIDVLQRVGDAARRGPACPTRGPKLTRDGELRSRPYPFVQPPTSAMSPPRRSAPATAPVPSPQGVSAEAAPAEPLKSQEGPGELSAEDLRGMVIARVPLLPAFKEKSGSLSPPAVDAVDRPPAEPTARRPTAPSGTHGDTQETYGVPADLSRSAEVLRGLASRGLMLLPGLHGARGISAGAGVIRIDID